MALMHVDFYSNVLGMSTQMDVILPEQARGQIGMASNAESGRCPVLYLLHGMSDDHTIWQRRTSIERYASEAGLAVIMPTTHLGWYTDMYRGFNYFTFISQELPKICRNMFPQISNRREDTFVAGLSMGGYGALKVGLLANDTFSHAASLSGALDAVAVVNQPSGRDAGFWRDIFGPAEQVKGSFNDLFACAERLVRLDEALPRVYIWCGTEDFLFTQNVAMRDHLRALGYDLTYEQSPGDHQWKYWDQKIQDVINWLPLEGRKA